MVKTLENPSMPRREPVSNGHSLEADAVDPMLPGVPETAEAALKEVRTLVEAGKVRLARERIANFLEIWPENERLQAADRVLGPPKRLPQRTDVPNVSREREFQWIREHALEYSGQWVALLDDRVLASGRDLKSVMAELQQLEGGADVLLHFQPQGPWIRQ
jgi:hypothetical protein